MRLTVDVKGLDETRAILNRAANVEATTLAAADEIGKTFVDLIRLGFASSTDPYGLPWEPLRIRDGQPLVDKTTLRDSYHHTFTPDSVTVGTNTPYAEVHQNGAVIKPKNKKALRFQVGKRWFTLKQSIIPARPMLPYDPLGLPALWAEEAYTIMLKHASKSLA